MAKQKSGVMRLHTLAVIAASVILLAVAFSAGLLVALRGADKADNATQNDDTTQDTTDTDDDTAAVDGVIPAVWYSTADQTTRPGNFYVRQWWEEQNGMDATATFTATVLGEVGGAYEGMQLVRESTASNEGIGGYTAWVYVIEQQKNDANPIVLTSYAASDSWGPYVDALPRATFTTSLGGVTFIDDTIMGMETPDTITTTDGAATFIKIGEGDLQDSDAVLKQFPVSIYGKDGTALSLYDRGDLSYDEDPMTGGINGEFFVIRPDGRAVWYTIVMSGWTVDVNEPVQTPAITWNDGSTVAEYYRGFIGGCGFQALTHVVDEVPKLLASGKTADGAQTVFTPEDYGDALLATDYQNWVNLQGQMSETADTSVAAFAKGYPVFYMQDGLDRWVQFTRNDVIPPGECGKPVIYLYPTETTNIDVSLAPQGGFTKSEPAYGNGWHVTAQPDGTLTNLADGNTYPYLFWEGRGGLYSAPEKYWVVARADVPAFLTSTLAKLGLNAKETADFMEFWAPRMTAAPYYKIGFHGTNVMNAIAPMTLSQKADTLVRVLMDYSELSAPIPANPPTLGKTPVRSGFTVIEWGGVIR